MPNKPHPDYGVPRPPFLYTLDQIAQIMNMQDTYVRAKLVHFTNVSTGRGRKDQMLARNIASLGEKPDWRVTDNELHRCLKFKGFTPRYDPWY